MRYNLEIYGVIDIIIEMRVHAKYLVGFLLCICCAPRVSYIPDLEKDVKDWVRNLLKQKSFSYEYELKTAAAKILAQGNCIIGWAEYVKGVWDYGDTVMSFEYIGVRNYEWSKKNRKWEKSARGEESDILVQIHRILEFERFELINKEGHFSYRFNATLPFLAPDRWKEMVGYINISNKFYLPELIWVGLPDSSVYWMVKLKDYNNNKKIKPPYVEIRDYEIKLDTSIDKSRAVKMIKRRLKLLRLDWKIKKEKEKITIKVPEVYQIDDIKELLAPGLTTIYGIAQNKSEGVKIGYIKNKPNQPIYLSDLKYLNDWIVSAELNFDNLFRPFIRLKLKEKIRLPAQVAIEVDGIIIGISSLDFTKKLDRIIVYPDMEYYELMKIRAFMCQPLFNIEIFPLTKGSR